MIPNSIVQGRNVCIGLCCVSLSIVWCTGKVFDFVWVDSVLCIVCLAVSAIHSVSVGVFVQGDGYRQRAFVDTSNCKDGQKVEPGKMEGIEP